MKDGKVIKSIKQTSVVYKCYFTECTAYDRILFSTYSESTDRSVIYGCQWPFDHYNGLLYLNEKLLSFFPLPGSEGKYTLLFFKYVYNTKKKLYCVKEMIKCWL